MAYVSALIAVFGVVILYFQWRTAHERVVLDLFDRRLDVFNRLEDSIRDGVNENDVTPAYWRFVVAEREARFLFGQDVIDELERIRHHFALAQAFSDIQPDNPNREKMLEQRRQAIGEMSSFVLTGTTKLFARYMRLDQAMPSLWWPSAQIRRFAPARSNTRRPDPGT